MKGLNDWCKGEKVAEAGKIRHRTLEMMSFLRNGGREAKSGESCSRVLKVLIVFANKTLQIEQGHFNNMTSLLMLDR